MKRILIIALLFLLYTHIHAQNSQDIHLLHTTLLPQLKTLSVSESQHLFDRLTMQQGKLKTARQRFFLGGICGFLMQKKIIWGTGAFTIQTGYVTTITDGDTFGLTSQKQSFKIKLLGVDTPEKGEVGNQEATAFLTTMIHNTPVTLMTPSTITTDKYGRTLAYVLTASGMLLNLHLLESGYARTMTLQEHPFISLFQQAQKAQNINTLTRRLYCTDFQTCTQARTAVASGATYLDGDGDGLPCEQNICK